MQYPFFLSEDGFPNYLSYEFRTRAEVKYSAYFMLNSYLEEFTDKPGLSSGYEFGLQKVDEINKNQKGSLDYWIQNTVVMIIADILSRLGNNCLITIQYSESEGRALKRFNAFDRWYEKHKARFPLLKYDVEIELGGKSLSFKSILVHENHPLLNQIIEELGSN